jgi:hypothetical protein
MPIQIISGNSMAAGFRKSVSMPVSHVLIVMVYQEQEVVPIAITMHSILLIAILKKQLHSNSKKAWFF